MREARHRMTDQHWRRVFLRQRRSGLSVVAFCKQEGIAQSTFFNRRRMLMVNACEHNPSAAFVEVASIDDEVAAANVGDEAGAELGPRGEPIELVLRSGVRIHVRPGFDVSLLRRVVDAIGGAA